jgi:hypothetical protein
MTALRRALDALVTTGEPRKGRPFRYFAEAGRTDVA